MKIKHHLDDLNIDGKGTQRRILKKEYDFSEWSHVALDRAKWRAHVYMSVCLQAS